MSVLTTETYTLPRDATVVHAVKDCREFGAKNIQQVGITDTTVTLEVTWLDPKPYES